MYPGGKSEVIGGRETWDLSLQVGNISVNSKIVNMPCAGDQIEIANEKLPPTHPGIKFALTTI